MITLQGHIFKYLKDNFSEIYNSDLIFMQDNTSIHEARSVMT